MKMAILQEKIPGITKSMQGEVDHLNLIVESLSLSTTQDILHGSRARQAIIRHWVMEAQDIHQRLIRCGIVEKSYNHPAWSTLDRLTTQQVNRVLDTIKKGWGIDARTC